MNLSQKLAIAIGWSPNRFVEPEKAKADNVKILCDDGVIRHFSIKDRNLMWKLAERYNAFPVHMLGGWSVAMGSFSFTPEEAIANYIINTQGK